MRLFTGELVVRQPKSKFRIKSFWFILTISLYFSSVLNLSFWRFIFTNLEITNISVAWFAFSLIFFIFIPLYIAFNVLLIPYLAKPVTISLLLISSAANYYMYSYGVYIDYNMITNIFETNTREALDFITPTSFMWVFISGVIPAIMIFFVKIEYRTFKIELKIRAALFLICIIVVGLFAATSYKEYVSFGRNNREVRKLLNSMNYIYSTFRYFQYKSRAKREFVILDPDAFSKLSGETHKRVIVLIIGETARAKNFSLDGYERDTNPLLSKQDIIYNRAISCGTATAVSVPCMFSHLERSDFNKEDAQYFENLVDILKKSGYNILWKENDDGCKNVCNRVGMQDIVEQNNPKYCYGEYCIDEALIDNLEKELEQVKNNTIIVLHTMGSHGPSYYNRYPKEFKKFTPTCDTPAIQNCSTDTIVNTYDNTILYTDYIISSTIDILKKFPNFSTSLIYVSDHGESLGENNIYLHGIPHAIAPKEQKEVPLVIWMSENMQKYAHIDYNCAKKNALNTTYSHDNIFHTVIGLSDVNTKLYDSSYDIFDSCRVHKP